MSVLNNAEEVDSAASGSSERIPVQEFHPPGVAEIDLYQKREKIYARRIEGFYQRIRVYTGWPLLLGYFLLPWLDWNGQQAVLFDLPARQFRIFFLTFWPQDFPLLAWLLAIAAFSLFAVTVWAGRVWCGYTCPQTVWTAIFMWAEQWCEGSRNQRIKRDRGPWTADKAVRKTAKHIMWIGFALLTGFTFVGYFTPIRQMTADLFTVSFGDHWHWGLNGWEIAWINFFTCATYINAGWMREQICKYVCPYARFQSVMFDRDTWVVSYDYNRGEPRGTRKRGVDHRARGLGDCVDCEICVQVCPVGIDIRKGLQYECINCALCIDGCNSVMEQMGYQRGLIRYATENELEGRPHTVVRPRLVGYVIAVTIMALLFATVLISRVPLELDVIRQRDRLYRETVDGLIENSYTLKVMNMDQRSHDYQITFSGLRGAKLIGNAFVTVDSGEVRGVPLRLRIDPAQLKAMNYKIEFKVTAIDGSNDAATEQSRFIGPRL